MDTLEALEAEALRASVPDAHIPEELVANVINDLSKRIGEEHVVSWMCCVLLNETVEFDVHIWNEVRNTARKLRSALGNRWNVRARIVPYMEAYVSERYGMVPSRYAQAFKERSIRLPTLAPANAFDANDNHRFDVSHARAITNRCESFKLRDEADIYFKSLAEAILEAAIECKRQREFVLDKKTGDQMIKILRYRQFEVETKFRPDGRLHITCKW